MRIFLTHSQEDLETYFVWALEPLRRLGEVVTNPLGRDLSTPELIDAAADCEIIVAHRATPGEAALFDALPGLVALLRPQKDIMTIDVDAASRNGVLVANAPVSFVASTAEMALALMLALARHLGESVVDYRAGREPPVRMGAQLRGAVAGIIGYGAVGSYLAGILVALGMRVLVYDPYKTVGAAGIEQVDLAALLRGSDFVLPLAAATDETANLIDTRALSLMKPTARLVNCSRGELVDEAALAAALDDGRLAGLAMDVGRAGDQRPSAGLAARPGIVATPHLGGATAQSAEPQALSPVEQIAAIRAGRMPPRAINPEHASRLHAFWAEHGLAEKEHD